LTAAARHVVAFEIDRDLVAALRAEAPPNLTVIAGDFLNARAEDIRRQLERVAPSAATLRVAGNLPYNVASPMLFKLIDLYRAGLPFTDATLMLQREVANRLLAAPGTGQYGVLSVLVRHEADVSRLLLLPPGAFRPMPQVDSTVVRLRFHAPDPPARDPAAFAGMVRAIFSRRRKTLTNALLAFPAFDLRVRRENADRASVATLDPAVALAAASLDGRRRPETLDLPELVRLSDAIEGLLHR
jgi:16S rRNA (adenine1518-N6/adenine1519-N6)-dimethyltransferase